MRENSTSADAAQHVVCVTHSSCCVLWVEMKKIGSHRWMSTFLWEAGGYPLLFACFRTCGTLCSMKIYILFSGAGRCTVTWHVLPPSRSTPEAHFLSFDVIFVLHSWPFSEPHSSVSILLFYVTAALTHIVKAIFVCVCLSILQCVFFPLGL